SASKFRPPSAKVAKLAKVFGLAPSLTNLELNFLYPLLTRLPPGDRPRLSAVVLANLRTSLEAAEMPVRFEDADESAGRFHVTPRILPQPINVGKAYDRMFPVGHQPACEGLRADELGIRLGCLKQPQRLRHVMLAKGDAPLQYIGGDFLCGRVLDKREHPRQSRHNLWDLV